MARCVQNGIQLELTNADENWVIFEVDNNGRDVADVAKEWLEKMKRVEAMA